MAEKEEIIKEKGDYAGVFDLKGFYNFAHGYLIDEKYGVTEEEYSEKVSGTNRDIQIKWLATKELSDYFKMQIQVKYNMSGVSEVEADIDGQRKKMNKGKLKFEIKGVLTIDPRSKWDSGGPFYKFMRDVYNKYVIPQRMENVQQYVRSQTQKFKEELKAYLDIIGRR